MATLRLQVANSDFATRIRKRKLDTVQTMHMVATLAAIDLVAFLRSLTNELRPPAKIGEPWRRAHPGHWADITSTLVNSYYWKVEPIHNGWLITIGNSAEYAIHLERKEGFYVVRGASDAFHEQLTKAVQRIAPHWEVQ